MKRKKKCYSGIGGQAVLEGIMMKNNTRYAVAVRKPDGEIDVETGEYAGVLGDSKIAKTPFVRGIFSFVDSMRLGIRCLNHSALFYEEEEVEETAADKVFNKIFKEKAENVLMALIMVFAILLAVGIFIVLPSFISNYLMRFVRNESLLAIIEGVVRILLFIFYVLSISLMKDIRRLYMYHGAEHKCINCIERGRELTVENVMKSSKQHRRCGTSFLLFVMLISVVLFFFVRVDSMALKILSRILLIPVIAGIAYEIIRLAGSFDNWMVRIISAPGLWLQGFTTKEPDESMVEVAIKAVEAVFDWRAYLWENFGYEAEEPEWNEDVSEEAMEYAVEEDEEIMEYAAEKDEEEMMEYAAEEDEEEMMEYAAEEDGEAMMEYTAEEDEEEMMEYAAEEDEEAMMEYTAEEDDEEMMEYAAEEDEEVTEYAVRKTEEVLEYAAREAEEDLKQI